MPKRFRFTSADLELFPQFAGVSYEIIDGELYVWTAPHWRHQHTAGALAIALMQWGDAGRSGEAVMAPGLVFAEDDEVIPDVIWISRERLRDGLNADGHVTVAPEWIVEVLMPGALHVCRDREIKLDLYRRRGVDEYWIADWRTRTVEVYRRAGADLLLAATLTGDDALTSPQLPGFRCPIASLWPPAT